MMTATTISEPHSEQPVPEIFQRIKAGDHAAFRTLVERYQSYAYALAMRFVWDRQEADDIVQESFIRVWDNIGSYRPENKFTTWLYAIVTRLCIDRIRSRNRWGRVLVRDPLQTEQERPADQPSPDERIDNEQLIERIRGLVERLPRAQRLVFTLRDLQDLTVDEVEEVTGLSATSIKANLCHARKRVREMLECSNPAVRR
jgi:RNA polymerase sigma-70 factor, ECF subfamily